jgi:hypothetical protein
MTLDLHSATKAFSDMLIFLGKMQGIAGHPLSYVPHPTLKGPHDADIDNKTEDPLPFGQPGSPYVSIDDKLCRKAPILNIDLSHTELSQSLETLESDGLLNPVSWLIWSRFTMSSMLAGGNQAGGVM